MICAGRIADDDSLFRHSVYPVAFKKGAHDWDKYWYLTNQANGFLGSLAWGKIRSHHGTGSRVRLPVSLLQEREKADKWKLQGQRPPGLRWCLQTHSKGNTGTELC